MRDGDEPVAINTKHIQHVEGSGEETDIYFTGYKRQTEMPLTISNSFDTVMSGIHKAEEAAGE